MTDIFILVGTVTVGALASLGLGVIVWALVILAGGDS